MAVTKQEIEEATELLKSSKYVVRTPMIRVDCNAFGIQQNVQLFLKMESMQTAGSFKMRGIINQIEKAPDEVKKGRKTLITMSAGNYGRAFAYMCKELDLTGRVLMPETAPTSRVELIKSYGVKVEQMPSKDLKPSVSRYVREEGMLFLHPFDDLNLIAGYGSIGIEILEDLQQVDLILVCCGGGGLLSGIASAINLTSKGGGTRVIGVEPQEACTMYLSLKEGRPVTKEDAKSIAGGLAPPFAGENTYRITSKFVDDIVLVTDDEIKECVKIFYNNGLVVEPSGVAGFAALKSGKLGDISNKVVVVIVSGRNITPAELGKLV